MDRERGSQRQRAHWGAPYDAAVHLKHLDIEAAASALQAARTAQIQAEIAEIALRDHIAQHGCKS